MAAKKTPGVYIVEKNAFPNSVVEVPTAIPAFIGITEKAINGADSLSGQPWKITSMAEFQQYFGGAPVPKFTLSVTDVPNTNASKPFYSIPSLDKRKIIKVDKPKILYSLYYQMILFFANGGNTCYIVSVGTYEKNESINKGNVAQALASLEKEQEITMVVVPEAVFSTDYKDIQIQMLAHCGKMKDRFAILDVQPKHEGEQINEQITAFRTNIGTDFLSYGAAYYPWLNASVLSDKDIDGKMMEWSDHSTIEDFVPEDTQIPAYFNKILNQINATELTSDKLTAMKNDLHNALLQNFPGYQSIVDKVKDTLNLLPPSAAMAGLYTMVDNTRGVWKAPANIFINCVNSPTENIDDTMQGDLNMPMNGKAVNAIRTFIGEGIKVWGARTLDGNSQDWRYINVHRTMMFLKESIENAAKVYVFEPNTANTWINVKSMLDNFLRSVWKRGGLAGATPEDAYEVHVGLGDTMISNDILNGIMRITVFMAMTRPAEFNEITFELQMQKS